MELLTGTTLQQGKYRIVRTLGRGGFGITYLAEQVLAKRMVCIKEFFPKDYYKRDDDSRHITLSSDGFGETMGRFKDKFLKEAQLIAALDHPNIIRIHDLFEENGTAYYVMEYIDGESLHSLVSRRGALSEADAKGYIEQLAAALSHIHAHDIAHLDVKPGNIMVQAKDNRAVLIDFGLSKHYDVGGAQTSSTPVGISHGYAPMEQYQTGGVSTFSPGTDIYSMGATLYFLTVGKTPPTAAVVGEDGLGVLPSHLSESTRIAIEHAMQPRRKDRPASVEEFLSLLDGASEDTTFELQTKPTPPKPADGKPKRKMWWLWLPLLAVVGIVFGIVLLGGEDAPHIEDDDTTTVPQDADDVIEYVDSVAYELPQKENIDESPQQVVEVVKAPAPSKVSVKTDTPSASEPVAKSEPQPVEVQKDADEQTQTIVVDEVKRYSVGDYYDDDGKRGVVFEVWDDGAHGKIVSLDEVKAAWDSRSKRNWVNGEIVEWEGARTDASSASNGKGNTDKIMRRADAQHYEAFNWCRGKGGGWYLPANSELMAISRNFKLINTTLRQYGDVLSYDAGYWSSTEYAEYQPEFSAYIVNLAGGDCRFNDKYFNFHVRAVSQF